MPKKLKVKNCIECKYSRIFDNYRPGGGNHSLVCFHEEVGGFDDGEMVTDDVKDFMAAMDFPEWCPLEEW